MEITRHTSGKCVAAGFKEKQRKPTLGQEIKLTCRKKWSPCGPEMLVTQGVASVKPDSLAVSTWPTRVS